jgi:DNA-binding GntR family transcriptional regulator
MNRDRSNLSSEVFEVIKQRIIRWQYPPGHRFTEQELCQEFQVSRSPVREALRMLSEKGLVEKTVYRGYHVRQLTTAEIHELYDVRLALESFIVEHLAQHGLPADIAGPLRETWEDLQANPDLSDNKAAEADEAFHETLARSTGNRALLDMLRTIDERLRFLRLADITTPERLHVTCQQHLEILDRIAAGDTAGARAALLRNVEQGREHVRTAFMAALAHAYSEPARAGTA